MGKRLESYEKLFTRNQQELVVVHMIYELRFMIKEWFGWRDQSIKCLAHWGWAGQKSDVNISTEPIDIKY